MNFDSKEIPKSLAEFTVVKYEKPISQGNTGTCWCFSTTSFYESEIYRTTGKKIDLSEFYPVYFEYIEKAKGYIKTRGKIHLGQGSETNAVQRMMEKYGIVPFEAYEGKPYDQPYYNHEEMFLEIISLGYSNFAFFDNYGEYICTVNDQEKIFDLLNYVKKQNFNQSTRTLYYYDVFAYSSDNEKEGKQIINEYNMF